jgi:hypothetical protein
VVVVMMFALLMVSAPTTVVGQNATIMRPIGEFVAAQGLYCLNPPSCDLFQPPVPNYIGWTGRRPGDPTGDYTLFSLVDYAGVANRWRVANRLTSLGTQTRGTVTERRLADGRAEVSVNLFASNALAWVETCPTPATCGSVGTPLFGYRADLLPSPAMAALAETFLQVVFINPRPGYQLPDLIQLAFVPDANQELRFISFRSNATGPLQSGPSAGAPGRSSVIETGLIMAALRSAFKGALADAFPVEMISVQPVGP